MKRWILELITITVAIILISIIVDIFGFETTIICILATVISKVIAKDIWDIW